MKYRMLKNILFLDIETASIVPCFTDLSVRMQSLWRRKALHITRKDHLNRGECIELFKSKAAIYAEFNRIVCISVGYLSNDNGHLILKIKSYCNDSEEVILQHFVSLLIRYYNNIEKYFICGHNIKEFDCPIICRKLLIYGIELPNLLKISRKKPWQVNHLVDTLEMWKFGDYKNHISLDLLCEVLKLPSSKMSLDGSKVSDVFWNCKDVNRIREYCEKDVAVTASVFLKLIQEKQFERVNFTNA